MKDLCESLNEDSLSGPGTKFHEEVASFPRYNSKYQLKFNLLVYKTQVIESKLSLMAVFGLGRLKKL